MSNNLIRFLFVFICIINGSHGFAQENNPKLQIQKDSLYQVLFHKKTPLNDKIKVIDAFNTYRIPMEDTVFTEIEKLLTNTQCTKKDKVDLHHYYGIGYYRKGELTKAEDQLEKAYQYFNSSTPPVGDPTFLVNYGLVKNNIGKNNEAVTIYLEGIHIAEETKNFKNLGNLYVKLGDVYVNMKKYDDANNYYQKAVTSGYKAKNKNVVAYALRGLGTSALESNNFSKAETIFKEALSVFDSLQHHFMINDVKCYLAATYDQLGKFDEAEVLYNEAHQYFKNSGYDGDLYYISVDIGKHFIKKGDYKKAITSCTFAKDHLLKIGDIAWAIDAWMCMYEAAKKSGNYKEALEYHEGYLKYNDSLINEKNIQKITELRKDFEFNKEKKIIALENKEKIQQEKTFQKFLGVAVLLLGGLLFFAYRAYRIGIITNKTISDQKDQLEIFNQANENLIYSLSHDIKEPMLGVQILLQNITSNDATLQNAKQSIGDQVSSINSIVDNLLLLKKSFSENHTASTDLITIMKTIQTITDQLQYKLNQKNIRLINSVADTVGLSIPISSQKLYLILLNLINNAIKYSPTNQKIEIFAKTDGIYVRDYGKGIDPNIINNLGKINIERDDTNGGSGMGLVLVSNLLVGSKVMLHFENAQGGGTIAGVVLS